MTSQLHETKNRPNLGEVVAGLVVAAVGIYMVSTAHTITNIGGSPIGPRFFPYAVGGLLAVTGLGIAASALRGHRAVSEGGEDVDGSVSTDWKTLGSIIGAFALFALLIQPVGYLLTTIFLFGSVAWILGARRWRGLVAVSFLVPLISYIFFTRVLGIYIPNGILEAII